MRALRFSGTPDGFRPATSACVEMIMPEDHNGNIGIPTYLFLRGDT